MNESGGNNLACQAYTPSHLEALRLRRVAGKGRAYSCDPSMLGGGTAVKMSNDERQWKPTLDVLDGSIGSITDSVVSAESSLSYVDGNPVKSCSSTPRELDMPDLSVAETLIASAAPADTNIEVSGNVKQYAEMKSVGTNTIKSTSCASIATLKSGNLNEERKLCTGANGKARSDSMSSDTPLKGNLSRSKRESPASGTKDAMASTTPISKRETKDKKSHQNSASKKAEKSPHSKSSENDRENSKQQLSLADGNKSNQTMREYVMNDLLNIDSRNQDGSATEDIDENMAEFLRVPRKLEWMMVFSLAVCLDSFLYVWAMLPLKFVWGVVCLICSLYNPKEGVRGISFHRR